MGEWNASCKCSSRFLNESSSSESDVRMFLPLIVYGIELTSGAFFSFFPIFRPSNMGFLANRRRSPTTPPCRCSPSAPSLEPSKCTFFIPHSFTLYLNFTLYLLYCTVQRYSSYCPAFSWKVVALDFEEISFDLKFRSCERIKKKKTQFNATLVTVQLSLERWLLWISKKCLVI